MTMWTETDVDLLRRFEQEMKQGTDANDIGVVVPLIGWWAVAKAITLGLSHPAFDGEPAREGVERLLERLLAVVAPDGSARREMVEAGHWPLPDQGPYDDPPVEARALAEHGWTGPLLPPNLDGDAAVPLISAA